ncbi:MAG: polyribonucleotide nucleotidyltransferase [Deltaproteobacteria bacterium]|nr:polyribonucleotide nucleotidyltransferase [Deltaproteobacteria bacterium]
MIVKESVKLGATEIVIEVGRLARQANGSALVRAGDTVVLVTACAAKQPREGLDFFPLTVDYIEKTFAAGKIPGGFFKREGRPTEKEVLTSRLNDRPIRPLFPKGYKNETQVIATVLSADLDVNPDTLASIGASVALHVSDIPWAGPTAGVRVGRIGGRFVANPTYKECEECDIDITMVATKDSIVMVEGGGKNISEEVMIDALLFGHDAVQPVLALIERIREAVGKPKMAFAPPAKDEALAKRVKEVAGPGILAAYAFREKLPRYAKLHEVETAAKAALAAEFAGREKEVAGAIDSFKKHYVREMILAEGRRIDGRGTKDIRPITCEVGLLPRTHGSGLFQRGETQAIVTTTLGTSQDEQRIELLTGEHTKRFMLHYNFPPFSVGEVKPLRSPGRREIGHGALAERAISRVMPDYGAFPYTVRIVSEILESNGSSSMASVCGASLSLMDCGVPVKAPVAGIAMGLIKEGDRMAVLSDILGDEDHLGDMDFKVCGTKDGVTALQMDNKVGGVSRAVLEQALYQARDGRLHILGKMAEAIAAPRPELSATAPRIVTVQIKPEQIKSVIGPGGKVIRGIIEETGCVIDVEDNGTVKIASADGIAAEKALRIIKSLTQEAEVGKTYLGTVRRIADFGAFIEILPGIDGMCHISELDTKRVAKVTDVLREGDETLVKVINVDRDGKIRLSRREAMAAKAHEEARQ